MVQKVENDLMKAHNYFSANCFNATWDLLDKPDRTTEEGDQMILLCMASAWHWTQRADVTDQNMSVGYWLISRVYAVLGHASNARKYGELCLSKSESEGIPPFYLAYAFEALARGEWVAGKAEKMNEYLEKARLTAEGITDAKSRKMVFDDLATIK